jgi:hypothetical protein
VYCTIQFVSFPFLHHQKKAQGNQLTKELGENACEEVQVAGNIVGHGRRKRFHKGVSAEYSLKKLHIKKTSYISNSSKNKSRYKHLQRKQVE